ncbi:hypothetical protein FIA58_000670 [Flavobacterium jejuense]|uniref:Uncharacterized protein n=1 Tax=Flavobacterium jejuense TaxID=1544455 RepID=A0ABX0IMC7_9FLAO|nr:hypothetical protein [Flavobacterium jejuense]NHN24175.1 hypothetical protein [Flavobacterium jejuense]
MILLVVVNNLLLGKHDQDDSSFLIGYYIGTLIGLFVMSWPTYKFFRFGGKLIAKSKVKDEIKEIGKE